MSARQVEQTTTVLRSAGDTFRRLQGALRPHRLAHGVAGLRTPAVGECDDQQQAPPRLAVRSRGGAEGGKFLATGVGDLDAERAAAFVEREGEPEVPALYAPVD